VAMRCGDLGGGVGWLSTRMPAAGSGDELATGGGGELAGFCCAGGVFEKGRVTGDSGGSGSVKDDDDPPAGC
jgi:hypothetical protein